MWIRSVSLSLPATSEVYVTDATMVPNPVLRHTGDDKSCKKTINLSEGGTWFEITDFAIEPETKNRTGENRPFHREGLLEKIEYFD